MRLIENLLGWFCLASRDWTHATHKVGAEIVVCRGNDRTRRREAQTIKLNKLDKICLVDLSIIMHS